MALDSLWRLWPEKKGPSEQHLRDGHMGGAQDTMDPNANAHGAEHSQGSMKIRGLALERDSKERVISISLYLRKFLSVRGAGEGCG